MAASEKWSSMDDGNSSMFLVPGFGPSRKKRQENWTTESTFALVNVWRDNIAALRSLKRNGHIYQKIAHQLHLAGFQRATFEVKTKIGNLTNEYRREKKRLEGEGGASRFKFWEVIHEMMTSDVTTSDGSTSREGFEDDDDSAFSIGDELVFPASMNPVTITSEWSPVDDDDDDDIEIYHEVPDDGEDGEDEEEEKQENENCEAESSLTSKSAPPLDHDYNVKIKEEVADEVEEQNEHKESRLHGESSFVTAQRRRSPPPLASSQRARCKKRKFRTEDERLKIMNMMYEENRRMNAATQRAEKEVLALMREQTDLQRQSMIVEERIARAIENACRALTASTASPLKRQCNGSANGLS